MSAWKPPPRPAPYRSCPDTTLTPPEDKLLWMSLSIPWRACVEEAWSAYKAGSLPIGAVVADGRGDILSRGRNRIHESSGSEGTLFGHKLSHAELNALVTLDLSTCDPRELHLYTTTEPCPLCVGAVRMSDIAGISYAARDPWAGSAHMFDSVPYISRGNVAVTPPEDRLLEDCLVAIQIQHFLRTRPPILDRFVSRYAEVLPTATEAGIALHDENTLLHLARRNAPAETMLEAVFATLL